MSAKTTPLRFLLLSKLGPIFLKQGNIQGVFFFLQTPVSPWNPGRFCFLPVLATKNCFLGRARTQDCLDCHRDPCGHMTPPHPFCCSVLRPFLRASHTFLKVCLKGQLCFKAFFKGFLYFLKRVLKGNMIGKIEGFISS